MEPQGEVFASADEDEGTSAKPVDVQEDDTGAKYKERMFAQAVGEARGNVDGMMTVATDLGSAGAGLEHTLQRLEEMAGESIRGPAGFAKLRKLLRPDECVTDGEMASYFHGRLQPDAPKVCFAAKIVEKKM